MLRALELRFFLAARVGVTLMFGLMQAAKAIAVAGRPVPGWLGWSHWAVLVLLLALFAAYATMLSGVQRKLDQFSSRELL